MADAQNASPMLTAAEESAARIWHASWRADPQAFARTLLETRTAALAETTEWLARAVGQYLSNAACSVATAESCTGGGIGSALTAVPGSSAWVAGGVISYSNAAKTRLLDVPAGMIARHGAVSLPVVRAMALGAQAQFQVACTVAVSGVAGPGGGTAAKPVGTVCFAWTGLSSPPSGVEALPRDATPAAQDQASASSRVPSGMSTPFAQTLWFPGDRAAVRAATVLVALVGLLGVASQRNT